MGRSDRGTARPPGPGVAIVRGCVTGVRGRRGDPRSGGCLGGAGEAARPAAVTGEPWAGRDGPGPGGGSGTPVTAARPALARTWGFGCPGDAAAPRGPP